MIIRNASVEDAPEIKDLVTSLSHYFLEDRRSPIPEWLSNTLQITAFEQRLSGSDYANFVYAIEDGIVGYISIKEKSHVYHLFVAENHQRNGISRALWDHATIGSGVNCYTVRSSRYAVPIYKRFGFTESEPLASKDGVVFQSMVLNRN